MKKLSVLFIAIAFFASFALIGCGEQKAPEAPAPAPEKAAPAPEKPADQPAPAPAPAPAPEKK